VAEVPMTQFVLRVLISALIIATVAEVAKRYTLFAAIIASLPLTSILAIIWLYYDTRDVEPIIELSSSIFWAVLPSLLFFVALPTLLRLGLKFVPSLLLSAVVMIVAYSVYVALMGRFGIKL
jgi:hypothetical protein